MRSQAWFALGDTARSRYELTLAEADARRIGREQMPWADPLAELLLKKAPAVSRRVEEQLLPKWLRQRGIARAA